MQNRLYFICLILATTLLTACGTTSEDNLLVGIWKLSSVDGEAIPVEQQITFEFKADGTAIRKFNTDELKNQWLIKEENKIRFLNITDQSNPSVNEHLEIKRLDASTLVLLDNQEAITLVKQN